MLYKTVSLAFAAQAVSGYSTAMPSKIAASRVSRAGPVEMAKKSVGDLTKADLEGKVVLVRCDLNAPFSCRYLTVGTDARMRVSSVMVLPSSGTLRSQRTSTTLPSRSLLERSPTDFLAISTGPARATREAAILDGMAML